MQLYRSPQLCPRNPTAATHLLIPRNVHGKLQNMQRALVHHTSWGLVPFSECPRQNGSIAPIPIQRAKRRGEQSPLKPPRSGPTKGWPLSPRFRTIGIECFRCVQVELRRHTPSDIRRGASRNASLTCCRLSTSLQTGARRLTKRVSKQMAAARLQRFRPKGQPPRAQRGWLVP